MKNVYKTSHRNRLPCSTDFVGFILLAVLFPLSVLNCFLRVCLPTFFAAVLKSLLPLTTSAIAGAANANKSAPMRFATGTIYLRKLELQFSQ